MHEIINIELLLIGSLQLILVGLIIYRLYVGKRRSGRDWLMKVFFLYLIHLMFFMGESATNAGLILLINPDILGLFHHYFFTLLFIAFGYGILDAIVTQPLHKRILKHNTILSILVLTFITMAIILSEGKELKFSHTGMEFIYEIFQALINLLVIVVLYNSWKDTGSRRLMLDTVAISLFFFGNTGHILTLIATTALPLHLEFTFVKYVLFTFALVIFAYVPSAPSRGPTHRSHT
ncbi:MAG: hypothetical protein V3V92_05370 [Candidatus Hydrothermarchaeales archaeon]